MTYSHATWKKRKGEEQFEEKKSDINTKPRELAESEKYVGKRQSNCKLSVSCPRTLNTSAMGHCTTDYAFLQAVEVHWPVYPKKLTV
jgi:hypothetical protein